MRVPGDGVVEVRQRGASHVVADLGPDRIGAATGQRPLEPPPSALKGVVHGPPGVGKTHVAISLAITGAESGRRVYYGTLTDLIDSLEEAQAAGRLNHRLKTLAHPALLVVDEIGYLPVTRSGAILFFQLVNRRYEHASTVVTSNKGFEQWGEILHDEVMAAALLDRLLHRCHIVNIRGNSYRMRRHMELSKAIHPTASRAVSAEHAGNGGTGS